MSYSGAEIWFIILVMGVCTFLIRFSFLGLIGDRPIPPFFLKLLRYTPVAVLPAMVAPLAIWPQATGGQTEPIRVLATLVTLVVATWRRDAIQAIIAGLMTLYVGLILTGQLG